jgi:glycerophosphoryl diester phosphodiesterase
LKEISLIWRNLYREGRVIGMVAKIYAHRGASNDAPENTLAAFRLAMEQGAEGIELDVQMTADGQLVVIHDETLDRTTNGHGLVVAHTYEEIKGLDASAKFGRGYRDEPIPLLREVLELIEPTQLELNIELKNGIIRYDGMEESVVRLVKEYGMEKRVNLSSFNHYSIVKLKSLAPEIETAILYVAGLYEPWNYAKTVGAGALHPYFYSVVPEIVVEAHQFGLKVRPYTVDEDRDIRKMIEAGVDAVITNHPLRMKRIRNEMEGKTD